MACTLRREGGQGCRFNVLLGALYRLSRKNSGSYQKIDKDVFDCALCVFEERLLLVVYKERGLRGARQGEVAISLEVQQDCWQLLSSLSNRV